MNPTPKEKEIKEYELGLARAALGALKRRRDVSVSSEPSTSTAAGGGEGSDEADMFQNSSHCNGRGKCKYSLRGRR